MKTAEQYMIALTKAEQTPSVRAMVDIILLDAAKAIDEAEDGDDVEERISDAYDNGYENGRSDGREEGYDEGYEKAKDDFSASAKVEDHIEGLA